MTHTNAEEQARRLQEKLERELGETIVQALADPTVVEVMLNADGVLWFDRLGQGLQDSGVRMGPTQAENLLRTIASALDLVVNADHPLLEGVLPGNGSRIAGVLPPISERAVFAIRKRASLVYTLDEYLAQGIATMKQIHLLKMAVRQRRNILVVGSTGSGKTTLANAILHEIGLQFPEHRIIILEDTVELQCCSPNHIALRTTDDIDMTRLLRTTMRMRPDRIVVGEVRGAEALAILKAWNTGHPGGIATVHANNARAGIVRIEQLVQEANVPLQPQLIAETVEVIVSIVRSVTGRRIEEIVSLHGYHKDGEYIFHDLGQERTTNGIAA